MQAPLEIISYFFPSVSVAADPQFNPEDKRFEPDLKVKVGVERENDNNSYQVALDISFEPESEEKSYPYSVHLVAIGIFKVAPDFPDPEKLLRITGASIIYGAAREFVITITSRGPWGPVMLPSISFMQPEDLSKKTTGKKKTNK